jgi:hypothetical protein
MVYVPVSANVLLIIQQSYYTLFEQASTHHPTNGKGVRVAPENWTDAPYELPEEWFNETSTLTPLHESDIRNLLSQLWSPYQAFSNSAQSPSDSTRPIQVFTSANLSPDTFYTDIVHNIKPLVSHGVLLLGTWYAIIPNRISFLTVTSCSSEDNDYFPKFVRYMAELQSNNIADTQPNLTAALTSMMQQKLQLVLSPPRGKNPLSEYQLSAPQEPSLLLQFGVVKIQETPVRYSTIQDMWIACEWNKAGHSDAMGDVWKDEYGQVDTGLVNIPDNLRKLNKVGAKPIHGLTISDARCGSFFSRHTRGDISHHVSQICPRSFGTSITLWRNYSPLLLRLSNLSRCSYPTSIQETSLMPFIPSILLDCCCSELGVQSQIIICVVTSTFPDPPRPG